MRGSVAATTSREVPRRVGQRPAEQRHHQERHRALDDQRERGLRHGPGDEERVGAAVGAEVAGQQQVAHQAEAGTENGQSRGQRRGPDDQLVGGDRLSAHVATPAAGSGSGDTAHQIASPSRMDISTVDGPPMSL